MSFLKNLFRKKEPEHIDPETRYRQFWQWFQQHQHSFHQLVKEMNQGSIQSDFFDQLTPELAKVHDGILFLTGMVDAETAELVLTPDGIVSNIVYVEELVAAAPSLDGWRFTALKPATEIHGSALTMHGYEFGLDNLFFYFSDDAEHPDEMGLIVAHDQFNEAQESEFLQAVYVFLDIYLGEYNAITQLDKVSVRAVKDAEKELMPIERLKNILMLKNSEISRLDKVIRQVEKEDQYTGLEATTVEGLPVVVTLNSTLLEWDQRASHPWMMVLEITYDGQHSSGMPSADDYELLENIEHELLAELTDANGHLYIGRETGDNMRTVYFACKDFRKAAKVADRQIEKYKDKFETELIIFKDRYWRCMGRFGF